MKSVFIKIPIVLALIAIMGCTDFLKEENPGNTTAENYYVTKAGYEGLVNAVYSSIRDVYQPTPYIFCAGTDLFFAAHQEVPLGLASYQTLTPGNSQVEFLFKTTYQSIQIANMALAYSTQTEDFTELATRVAEVKVIRAFFYFQLVQQFGDLSLVTELVDEPITHFDRTPASEVYDFIITELEEAIGILP